MAKRYVVTGGAGFIGSNLVDALVLSGAEVVVVDDLSAGKREHVHPSAELRVLDIRDGSGALATTFTGADGVFHLAAIPRVQVSIAHPVLTSEVNIIGTINVLEAARNAGVERLVFASSSSVYGDQDRLPLDEDMTPNPLSPYAIQKLAGEHFCRVWAETHGVNTVALRFFNVYGPRLNPEGAYALVIGKFLRQRQHGKLLTICGDGEQTRDFTHVSDVVAACIRAMTDLNTKGIAINIGAGNPVSVNRIAELIGGPVIHINPRPGEPRRTCADITRAEVVLGWKPKTTIEAGITDLKEHIGLD